MIPGHADLAFNFRFGTASSIESLQSRITAILDKHGLQYDLEWEIGARPFLTPRGSLVDALSEATQEIAGIVPALSTTGGTSDGRFIADIADQIVEFGPINASIHKIDENVGISELEQLAQVYRRTLEKLLHE